MRVSRLNVRSAKVEFTLLARIVSRLKWSSFVPGGKGTFESRLTKLSDEGVRRL